MDITKVSEKGFKKSLSMTFRLFSELLLGKFDKQTLKKIFSSKELLAAFRSCYSSEDGDVLAEFASDHYRIFGLRISPYAASYLTMNSVEQSQMEDSLKLLYSKNDFFYPILEAERVDHIGVELLYLSFLLDKDLEDDNVTDTGQAQLEFLQWHVLSWIVPFKQNLDDSSVSFFSLLLNSLVEVLHLYWISLRKDQHTELSLAGRACKKETVADILPTIVSEGDLNLESSSLVQQLINSPDTDLKALRHFFMTPFACGFFLCRNEIERIGLCHQLPISFGSRSQCFASLLQSSMDYGRFGNVVADLIVVVEKWRAGYDAYSKDFSLFYDSWNKKCQDAHLLLTKMQEKLKESHG
ncbi:MAG: molecular chaperone TorD family protein [Bdellovibrionota bacterium]